MTDLFKELSVDVGEIKRGQKDVSITWELADGISPQDIDLIKPGCGCTANFDWLTEPGKVTAKYNDNTPKGKSSFAKSATVVFKGPGEAQIKNNRGQLRYNPVRKTVSIHFTGKVK